MEPSRRRARACLITGGTLCTMSLIVGIALDKLPRASRAPTNGWRLASRVALAASPLSGFLCALALGAIFKGGGAHSLADVSAHDREKSASCAWGRASASRPLSDRPSRTREESASLARRRVSASRRLSDSSYGREMLRLAATTNGRDGCHLREPFDVCAPPAKQASPSRLIRTFSYSSASYRVRIAESQGDRPLMEDRWFYQMSEAGTLLGVFDGHGGDGTASYLGEHFADAFFKRLRSHPDEPIDMLFFALFKELDEAVCERFKDGATAVICFLSGGAIYTATLGDAAAKLYLGESEAAPSFVDHAHRTWLSRRCVPLSPLVCWSDEGEQERVDPRTHHFWGTRLRSIATGSSINISRAFGDGSWKPPLSAEPYVTAVAIPAGCAWRLVLGSDGWTDGISSARMGLLLHGLSEGYYADTLSLAELSVRFALRDFPTWMAAGERVDNITVIALEPRTPISTLTC